MSRYSAAGTRSVISYLLFLVAGGSAAAPVINSTSGPFIHKSEVTISGSSFGVKSPANPVVWDDASTGLVPTDNNKWDNFWPQKSEGESYHLRYTERTRDIALPHANATRYLAGSHGNSNFYGTVVALWKNRTIASYPAYTYATWYQRADDKWKFCERDSYSSFVFSDGDSPYLYNSYWAIGIEPHDKKNNPMWQFYDPSGVLDNINTLEKADNPMNGKWIKIQLEIKYTNEHDGSIKLLENGKVKIDYHGPTDRYTRKSSKIITEGIGGNAGCFGFHDNWRYFGDIYLDHSRARVVLANDVNITNATIIEPQIPISWSDGSIKVTSNIGSLVVGKTAYLFVFDDNGVANANGFAITVSTSPLLWAPTNLHIQ